MKTIYPPEALHALPPEETTVFLAGSIEMGKALNWQEKIKEALADYEGILLNPRRLDWNSSWKQEKNNPQFYEQVQWELQGLEIAELAVVYLDPATQSPISMLELGLHARSEKIMVCCPEGFWRKGNIDIVCERYKIPQCSSLEELIAYLQSKLTRKGHK